MKRRLAIPLGSGAATRSKPERPPAKYSTQCVENHSHLISQYRKVAIVLGHMSLSDIKRTAGRLKGEGLAITGLVLGYLGIVAVPLVLIVAAIAIPNLLRAKIAANESSAMASVRNVVSFETSYDLELCAQWGAAHSAA
jgi:hypothetical protein